MQRPVKVSMQMALTRPNTLKDRRDIHPCEYKKLKEYRIPV